MFAAMRSDNEESGFEGRTAGKGRGAGLTKNGRQGAWCGPHEKRQARGIVLASRKWTKGSSCDSQYKCLCGAWLLLLWQAITGPLRQLPAAAVLLGYLVPAGVDCSCCTSEAQPHFWADRAPLTAEQTGKGGRRTSQSEGSSGE